MKNPSRLNWRRLPLLLLVTHSLGRRTDGRTDGSRLQSSGQTASWGDLGFESQPNVCEILRTTNNVVGTQKCLSVLRLPIGISAASDLVSVLWLAERARRRVKTNVGNFADLREGEPRRHGSGQSWLALWPNSLWTHFRATGSSCSASKIRTKKNFLTWHRSSVPFK